MRAEGSAVTHSSEATPEWVLVVHGGVDPRTSIQYSPQEHRSRHEALAAALQAGQEILARGGSSVDAVQSAVRVLEDAPEFNAGRGGALTHDGHAELDASIMQGHDRRAGAVAGVRRVRNPIDLARAVMERSPHVFLIGEGAEAFAVAQHITFTDPAYFRTERQINTLRKVIDDERAVMSGTVGSVAMDRQRNLAAATSTGGMTNKRYGRVGDTPVIGAGTYADNAVCAVSATGWGEFFIRTVVAHDLCARMQYGGHSLENAARQVIDEVSAMGGYGGVIAIDAKGRIAAPYSTAKMAHAYVRAGSAPVILLED
jgi:beta-aspartyl-peptidase (threonine type)